MIKLKALFLQYYCHMFSYCGTQGLQGFILLYTCIFWQNKYAEFWTNLVFILLKLCLLNHFLIKLLYKYIHMASLSCMSLSNIDQVEQCLLKHTMVIVDHCSKKKRHVWEPLSEQLLSTTSVLLRRKWVRAKGRYPSQGGPKLLLIHVCCLSSIGQQLCGNSCWTTTSCKLVWYPSA